MWGPNTRKYRRSSGSTRGCIRVGRLCAQVAVSAATGGCAPPPATAHQHRSPLLAGRRPSGRRICGRLFPIYLHTRKHHRPAGVLVEVRSLRLFSRGLRSSYHLCIRAANLRLHMNIKRDADLRGLALGKSAWLTDAHVCVFGYAVYRRDANWNY